MNSHDFARKLLSLPECEMLEHSQDQSGVASSFEYWSIDEYGGVTCPLGSLTITDKEDPFPTGHRVGILLR